MFIRGGQTNNIIIQPNDFAISFTNYDSSETHAGIKLVCTIGSDDNPFEGKSFGFLGDSITHGLDPDNSTHDHTTVLPHPWANQVADALGANMINYGVNSATVVPVANHPTPLIEKYKEMSPDLDYVIVMGGINDAFNQIPLGKMEDRDSSTFYGGLHILYKALAQKYKRKDGKHVIVMTYPRYDALHTVRDDVTFDQFVQAMRDVAGYYSIPILDLYNNCEISPFSDDEFEYWIENNASNHDGLHNPHPRQSAADIIADTMCRYLKSSYME
ncbi:SGNH/GDSL hydrolase family protein [Lactiplantibacillus plantarum]|uniref:SGNH/GDSL hydrolase family protein n=1 Tax=Lactiplantibacillus plantarum TaxID=1590 RepID=UPI0025529EA1|nr:SGNH/GDSL hydrolase family protein [Lactiplantibacillus plantarum]